MHKLQLISSFVNMFQICTNNLRSSVLRVNKICKNKTLSNFNIIKYFSINSNETKHEEIEDNQPPEIIRVNYEGPFTSKIRFLRRFSFTSSILSFTLMVIKNAMLFFFFFLFKLFYFLIYYSLLCYLMMPRLSLWSEN